MPESTRLTTPFGSQSTALEVLAGVDLSGQRAVVTGGASGIGVETARALANSGVEVTLAVRDLDAGNRVAQDIAATAPVHVASLELSDPDSVARFVQAWNGPLHILVNNAGIMAPPLSRTSQGWEMQWATNHLGHFALTTGLHGALAAAGGARVVSVSSSGHNQSPVVFDDINYEVRDYDKWTAYGQSKTANILLAVEITRRWADDGISANALMPGVIMTNLMRHQSQAFVDGMEDRVGKYFKTPEQGAATSVLLAGSPLLDGVSGRYFEDCNEAVEHVPGTQAGVCAYALDPEAATRLWSVSADMLAAT